MADQKVSDAALLKLENDLTIKFNSVQGQLKRLHATIDGLEGKWKGIGANQFNITQTEVNNRMLSLAKQLTRYQEAIKAARTISGNNEDEIRDALKGVDVVAGHNDRAKENSSSLNDF
ncbi:WXG100 family type VII secretion target [Streptomyces sp. NPDC005951]|uniref:WXG100 family type VII secretion target n=1 Tax=Streptomyces pakalii TaxID=3036494 RepID=A0ABT7DFR7_9ACTN|nr:WXG100 family type VII secretion target [Streptomyces pakalii]MDJ1643699.1 WXG100 family type VII secretion target [Streptomyces pakalii]